MGEAVGLAPGKRLSSHGRAAASNCKEWKFVAERLPARGDCHRPVPKLPTCTGSCVGSHGLAEAIRSLLHKSVADGLMLGQPWDAASNILLTAAKIVLLTRNWAAPWRHVAVLSKWMRGSHDLH